MTIVSTLGIYITLYDLNIQYLSCDYALLYVEALSERVYPNSY